MKRKIIALDLKDKLNIIERLKTGYDGNTYIK